MLRDGIVISEILVDPSGVENFDTDGNGTAAPTDEYVELYNSSTDPIDISGFELWDQGGGRWFTFPSGTILQPDAHAMVMSGVQAGGSLPSGSGDSLFFDAGRSNATINNGGDNVVVYDPANDEFIQATYNGDLLDDPVSNYAGFSSTATRIGLGDDFGADTDGQSLQRVFDDSDVIVSRAPTPGASNVCFADGTYIATPNGNIPIEQLRAGDLVYTLDRMAQPITWTYSHRWTAQQIKDTPSLAAVHIRAGALGAGMPSCDLRVSQQHRILIEGPIAQRMFGTLEVLIPAKALLGLPDVSLEFPETGVTYFHIMLDQHEVVFSNGIPSESLFLGLQALSTIPHSALNEICAVLGVSRLQLGTMTGPITPVRNFARRRKAVNLVSRHAKNCVPIVQMGRM